MSKQAVINDVVQMFSDLPYQDQLVYRYGYVSSSEMSDDLLFELQEADEQEVLDMAEDINRLLQKAKNG
jgi:hypothetical protein